MNYFSYPLTIVQTNIFEEPQNIFSQPKSQTPNYRASPPVFLTIECPPPGADGFGMVLETGLTLVLVNVKGSGGAEALDYHHFLCFISYLPVIVLHLESFENNLSELDFLTFKNAFLLSNPLRKAHFFARL